MDALVGGNLPVLDMLSGVDGWKQFKQPVAGQVFQDGHVQQAVINARIRCDQEMGAGVTGI